MALHTLFHKDMICLGWRKFCLGLALKFVLDRRSDGGENDACAGVCLGFDMIIHCLGTYDVWCLLGFWNVFCLRMVLDWTIGLPVDDIQLPTLHAVISWKVNITGWKYLHYVSYVIAYVCRAYWCLLFCSKYDAVSVNENYQTDLSVNRKS